MKRALTLLAAASLLSTALLLWPSKPKPESSPPKPSAAEPPPDAPSVSAPRLAERVGDAVAEVQQAPKGAELRSQQLADPRLDFARRRKAADALAHAQTPAAQAALRSGIEAMLDDPQLPAAAKALLAQRLGFVREPDQATLDLALRLAQTEPSSLRRAGLMTLGAVARNSGSAPSAMGPIRAATSHADPAERAVGYRALGNLASPDALAQLRQAATLESDGQALAGIAQGLGADPSEEGTEALSQLASTSHPPTQLRALTGLIGRSLSSEAAAHLAAAGRRETLFAENASAWTSAAMGALSERPVRRAAQAMLERGDVGPQVRARIRQALGL